MATKVKAPQIAQPVVYRCTDKSTKKVFYLVKSDSQPNTWYTLAFDATAAAWSCSCPAAKPCKHMRAVQDVLRARREMLAEKIGGDLPAEVRRLQRLEDQRQAETSPVYRREVAAATISAANATLRERRPMRQYESWGSEDQRFSTSLNGNQGFSFLR